MLAPLFDEVEERFSVYVFELRRILKVHNLPVDGHDTVQGLVSSLAKSPNLRLDVTRMMRAMIRREREQISSVELLAVLMQASGRSLAEHADTQAEAAIEELLGFILEVRYPHAPGEENKSPVVASAKAAEGMKRQRAAFVERSGAVPAASLFEESEDGDTGSRTRIMLVAACVAVLGLAIPFALHHSEASQKPRGAAVSDTASASEVSKQPASAIHGTRNAGRRGWLSPKTSSGSGNAAARTASYAETASVATAPFGPRESARAEATRASVGVQPVRPGAKEYGAESPLASGGSVAGPANRAIAPVNLGTAGASSSEAGARIDGRGFVHSASAGIMAGNVISNPPPAYPAGALSAGVQGEVTVRAVVGRDGNVTEARIVSGPPLLREAAVQAVEQWQYRPYLVDGKPAAIGTTAILDFKLPRP